MYNASSHHVYIYIDISIIYGISCFIVQQEIVEARDITLIHYNKTHPFERTSEGVIKAMSTTANKQRVMLFFDFTKQLAIANQPRTCFI